MKTVTTNTNNEIFVDEVPDVPEGQATSGYPATEYDEENLDSPETLAAVESMITSQIDENAVPKMNRAQRRALAKKMGKRGRKQSNTISETAKKLNYIELIQRLRELNKNKEEVDNNENQ